MTTVLTSTQTRVGAQTRALSTVLAVAVVGIAGLFELSRRTWVAGETLCLRVAARVAARERLAPRGMRAAILGLAVWVSVVVAGLVGMSRGLGPG